MAEQDAIARPSARLGLAASALALAALAVPAVAAAHSERPTQFPDPADGSVPEYRTTGGTERVVCKSDSAERIDSGVEDAGAKQRNLALLESCTYRHVQDAVEDARSNDRILVLPGVYREEPSRAVPLDDPRCEGMNVENESGFGVPSYEYQLNCPRSRNLVAIAGDSDDDDRDCDVKCNVQIEGTGDDPRDVLVTAGDDRFGKPVGVRADRADGVVLKNFAVEHAEDHGIYVLETDGFRLEDIVTYEHRSYGILTFTVDHGLYNRIEAYRNGDSGIYPGSSPDRPPGEFGVEIKDSESYENTIGYSGTAGNSVDVHDNSFHDNAAGITTDSFASGHPGMPQDGARFADNEIRSNNLDLFNEERDEYCASTDIEDRDPSIVCPQFQVPVGTGLLIAGGNENVVEGNRIWDNWRDGVKQFFVPAAFRGEDDPAKTVDTSFDNTYRDNVMGVDPEGNPDPNGNDFWWDEQGRGNCWAGNEGPGGAAPTSNVPTGLPQCGSLHPEVILPAPLFLPGNTAKQASQAPCATWDPEDNPDPIGCDWFEQPEEPQPEDGESGGLSLGLLPLASLLRALG